MPVSAYGAYTGTVWFSHLHKHHTHGSKYYSGKLHLILEILNVQFVMSLLTTADSVTHDRACMWVGPR